MDKKPEARPGSLDVSHDASVTWRYLAPAGHTLEMCLMPDYWTHCTRELGQQRVIGRHAWNKIEIIAEDGTWEAELRVLKIEQGANGAASFVHTRLLSSWQDSPKPGRKPSAPDGYTVEHIHENGWRAMDSKGRLVIEKQTTEEEAMKAAREHARKASAGGKAA